MSLLVTEENLETQQPEETQDLLKLLEELDSKVTPNLPETEEVKEIQSDKNLKLDRYLLKFKVQIDAWKASHLVGVPPPIHWDSDYKDWVWQNREQRRYK